MSVESGDAWIAPSARPLATPWPGRLVGRQSRVAIAGEFVSLLEALQGMGKADASVLLVSTDAQGRKTENVVGAPTLAQATHFLGQVDEIETQS